MKKKKQHYVFQGYLKPWAKAGMIYCLRDGRVFKSNLTGVACEHFFYRLRDLTPEEMQFIDRSVIESSAAPLKEVQRNFLNLYSFAPNLKKAIGQDANPEYLSLLDETIANLDENYHAGVEAQLLGYLRSMLEANTDFYSDDREAANFLYAISLQYVRTKRMREAVIAMSSNRYKEFSGERGWSVLSHAVAISLGRNLYINRKAFRLRLVDNPTDTPLITGDQPIINMHSRQNGEPPDRLEFYYPLSPTRALMLVEISSKLGESPMGEFSVNNYNVMMLENSHEQLFSDSFEYLSSIKSIAVCQM